MKRRKRKERNCDRKKINLQKDTKGKEIKVMKKGGNNKGNERRKT